MIVIRDMKPEDEDFVSMCGHSLEEAKEHPEFIYDCHKFGIHRRKYFHQSLIFAFK